MNTQPNAVLRAFRILSIRQIADACGVSHTTAHMWKKRGRLPRTEATGETNYAAAISALTRRRVSVKALREAGYGGEKE